MLLQHTIISCRWRQQQEVNDTRAEVEGDVTLAMNYGHCVTIAVVGTRHSSTEHQPRRRPSEHADAITR